MKVIGFILVALGILVGACSKVVVLRDFVVKIGFSSKETIGAWGVYIGGALVVIGLLVMILLKDSAAEPKEVPIYQGNQVVGYRRHKN